jgi:hypothetical protein
LTSRSRHEHDSDAQGPSIVFLPPFILYSLPSHLQNIFNNPGVTSFGSLSPCSPFLWRRCFLSSLHKVVGCFVSPFRRHYTYLMKHCNAQAHPLGHRRTRQRQDSFLCGLMPLWRTFPCLYDDARRPWSRVEAGRIASAASGVELTRRKSRKGVVPAANCA